MRRTVWNYSRGCSHHSELYVQGIEDTALTAGVKATSLGHSYISIFHDDVGEAQWTTSPLGCINRKTNVIRELLATGASPMPKDNKGQTPIDIAREQGRTEAVKLLTVDDK